MAKRTLLVSMPAVLAVTAFLAATPSFAGVPAAATGSAQSSAAPPAAAKSTAVTPDPYIDGSVQAGAAKAAECFACHGPDGNSVVPTFPRLAGQNAVYIAEQLHLFRSGVRPNPVMGPMAQTLSNQDIDNLAVFFAAQTPTGLEADPTLWKAGQALYLSGDPKRGVPACVACHGPLGRGNPAAGYPALQAQQAVYVVAQLTSYADGTRYTGPHATPNSSIMFDIAKRLTPSEMQAVASYVQGLR